MRDCTKRIHFTDHMCERDFCDSHFPESLVPVYGSFCSSIFSTLSHIAGCSGTADCGTFFVLFRLWRIGANPKAGSEYVNHMPKSRILKTWIHFALAVVIFLLLSFIFKIQYSPETILFLYTITYLSFKKLSGVQAQIFCVISSLLYIAVMHSVKDGSWWYDTVLCYSAGVIFSAYKNKISSFLNEKYGFFCVMCFALTVVFYLLRSHLIAHELLGILFCMDIVLACACVRIENKVLLLLGKHAFEIYILQRIPMIVLSRYLSGYSFICTCFVAAVILAVLFKQVERKADIFLKI